MKKKEKTRGKKKRNYDGWDVTILCLVFENLFYVYTFQFAVYRQAKAGLGKFGGRRG